MEKADPTSLPSGVSSIIRIDATQLASHPLLESITRLINLAFMTSWATIPGLVGEDSMRYDTPEDFVKESQPDVVVYVALDAKGEPIGTIGYRQWNPVWVHMEAMESSFEGEGKATGVVITKTPRTTNGQAEESSVAPAVDPSDRYEVVLLTVDPRLKGTGIPGFLNKSLEQYLQEVTRHRESKSLALLVRTGKEHNELYWSRKGYRENAAMKFAPGYAGSTRGFTLLEMEKVISV